MAMDGGGLRRNSDDMRRTIAGSTGFAAAVALALAGLLVPAPAHATDDPTAGCRRLIKEKWESSRALALEDCLDRLAGSPSPYDANGYKLALWGDVLLASDGVALYQSDDGGSSWTVVRQPDDLTRNDLATAPADPPPLPPGVEAPAEAAAPAADAGANARYRMWLALARRCEPALPDQGAALRDLQFKASECERRLRQPPGNVSTTQNDTGEKPTPPR